MPAFTISNPPARLTMLDVSAAINSLGGPAKECRWAARVVPAGVNHVLGRLGYTEFMEDLVYLCEATSFPGRSFDVSEVRYYGPSLVLPRNPKYEQSHSMTFLCRQESFERQLFDDWLEMINPSTTWDFRYPTEYYCEIQLFQLAEYAADRTNAAATEPKATYAWSLLQAWPIQVNPQEVTWAGQDLLRLTVTFAYRYWQRPGRDGLNE